MRKKVISAFPDPLGGHRHEDPESTGNEKDGCGALIIFSGGAILCFNCSVVDVNNV
jgi:hypothetical protein